MPGCGLLHFAYAALRNVQLFGGRYPVVQTVTFTAARACLRVFVGIEGSAGGVSAAPADDTLADALAPGCRPEPRAEGPRAADPRAEDPVHAPIVMPTPTASTN